MGKYLLQEDRLHSKTHLYWDRANDMTRDQFPKTSLRNFWHIFACSNLKSNVKKVIQHQWKTSSTPFLSLVAVYFYKLKGKRITCLQHLLNAEVGMLGGAIWSKMPPVALNMGMTSIKIATETSPKHNTSAFWTLKSIKRKLQGKEKGWKQGRGALGNFHFGCRERDGNCQNSQKPNIK